MLKNTGDEMNLNIEEREIFLFVDNDGEIYKGLIKPLINNYARRLVSYSDEIADRANEIRK